MEVYEYIQHSGTKGMRWGIRRYQNKDGSLTPAGRKHYAKETEKLKVAKAKLAAEKKVLANKQKTATKLEKLDAAKKKLEAEKKALKEEKKRLKSGEKIEEKKTPDEIKKQHEEDRKKAIESGSATDVLKFKGEYTKAEMDAIANRLNWEKNMKDISDKEMHSGKSKTEKMMDKVGKATDYGIKGVKAYNLLANIYNGVKGDHILPKIDTNVNNDNINNRKQSKKEKQKAKEAEAKRKQQEAEGPAKREERAKKKAEKEAAEQAKKTENSDNSKTETWEGTVEGTGTSKGSQSKSTKTKSSDYYDPIDGQGEWVNESVSNLPAVRNSSGRSRVDRYLEDYGGMLLEDFSNR